LAGVAVLAFTVYFWNTSCFAIAVTYGGKSLGVVASEQTFRDAAAQVEQNVSDASGSNFKLNNTTSIKMVLAKKTDLSDEDQIYNNIVMMSSSEVQSGYGLYVDNRLAGANASSTAIEAMLNDMTSKYENDPSVQSVGFVQDVSIKNGVFPGSVFKTISNLKNVVTANDETKNGVVSARVPDMFRISLDPLYAMNLADGESVDQNDIVVTGTSQPTLTVKVVKNEVYTQPIPYSVEQVSSASLKSGSKKIDVAGRNGMQKIVAAVTYVDGVKTDEDVLTTTTTSQPVAQRILVGTRKASQGFSSSSGYSYGGYYGNGGNPPSGNPGTVGGLVGYAEGKIGIEYVPGGSSNSGFDCSGFTSYVFSKYGISLPHSAAEQSAYGSPVSRSSLQAGDLVFFDTNGGHNSITHVGIYIGGGSFIDASSARPHSVTIDSLNSNYYTRRYMTARRVIR
jgi:cell wall-associated NlpC family hydrolase